MVCPAMNSDKKRSRQRHLCLLCRLVGVQELKLLTRVVTVLAVACALSLLVAVGSCVLLCRR